MVWDVRNWHRTVAQEGRCDVAGVRWAARRLGDATCTVVVRTCVEGDWRRQVQLPLGQQVRHEDVELPCLAAAAAAAAVAPVPDVVLVDSVP